MGMIEEARALLGKQVVVTLGRGEPTETDTVIARGTLLGFGDGGDFEIQDEMGFVHYCWPMLDIRPA